MSHENSKYSVWSELTACLSVSEVCSSSGHSPGLKNSAGGARNILKRAALTQTLQIYCCVSAAGDFEYWQKQTSHAHMLLFLLTWTKVSYTILQLYHEI